MAAMIYLDTHVVAWLYNGSVELLSPLARQLIEAEELLISPMVSLELQYLYEVGKTAMQAEPVLESLRRDIALEVCDLPFAGVVQAALSQAWTRDPFDRLITATAMCRGAPLLTKDTVIRANYSRALWDDEST